ncbi:hypothetical protein DTO166G4_3319 [Paecilomyces variotii]|nr:hypothetical protein DTO166G4_3319 [Paecilomyces variotii]KAJ9239097.1 hypothetical protein DTO166G5_2627 [Paecilomyces variotii]KAJ9309999.1 hypothetical protein DTO217A2_637 [Paecilomyces variotii]KAJ9367977.1 hypothetical protein DTO282E5_7339 [Paecilomyces variotii]
MVQSDPDERLIYLACQHIFRGANSQVRKLKTVKGLIRQNELALTDILREYDINRTSTVAKKLLESEVFDSTLKARIRFPELFDLSPTQSAEREASEAEAARDEANTVREISDREASKDTVVTSHTEVQGERTFGDNQFISAKCSDQDTDTAIVVRSLYPVYIHYRCQHLVLTTIQELLEESCFEFAQQHFPQLLAANGWDCPEAVELTEWTKILSRQSNPLINTRKSSLNESIGLLRELRHSAVHRLRKTAAGVERLAENAQLFLEALEDTTRSEKVESIRRELRSGIDELKRNKDLLERRLLAQLKEIQRKRSELDVWEKNAKEAMIKEDLECSRDIGEGLEIIVRRVKLKDQKEVEGKKHLPDAYSDSVDSEEEFLGAALITPQF